MQIFQAPDYKAYVNTWLENQPKKGHGLMGKMATHLGISSVTITQVLRGNRQLTLEQGLGLASFLKLTKMETEFFMLLVQRARAVTKELEEFHDGQISAIRSSTNLRKSEIEHTQVLAEHKNVFYSSWRYSAVRLACLFPGVTDAKAIAKLLKLDVSVVNQVLEFLLEAGLVKYAEGAYGPGPSATFIGRESALLNRHHTNWRLKGLQAMESNSEEDYFFTAPMALSSETAAKVRVELGAAIQKILKQVTVDESQELRCLGVDWFRF